jgi:hypothetical protein
MGNRWKEMDHLAKEKLPSVVRIYPRFSDFFVDFFGALVPGIIFTAILIIFFMNYTLLIIDILNVEYYFDQIKTLSNLLTYFDFVSFMLFILTAYIFGYMFLRRGPIRPDKKSFKRYLMKKLFSEDKKDRDEIQYILDTYENDEIRDIYSIAIHAIKELHWPYHHLHGFLGKYMPHLAKMIDWGELDKKTVPNRPTRMKINAIKEAIQFHFPNHYGIIAKHEGQVRFLSSIWYICNYLNYLALVGILILSGYYYKNNYNINLLIICSFMSYIAFIITSMFVKISIEDNFHYRRVREITTILNIAFQARKIDKKFGREFWDSTFSAPQEETSHVSSDDTRY